MSVQCESRIIYAGTEPVRCVLPAEHPRSSHQGPPVGASFLGWTTTAGDVGYRPTWPKIGSGDGS